MFRRFDIKTLGLVFIGLLCINIVVKVMDNAKGNNTLKDVIFDVDQEQITSVILKPKILNGRQIELKKQGEQWKVLADGKSYNGDANIIEGLIKQVNGLKPLRLAAQDEDKWERFELTDSLSTAVNLMGSKGELAQLFIGKFTYQQPKQNPMMQQNPYMQQRGTMTTYVRSGEDKEVFAVEGFLASSANRDESAFRDKTIVKATKSDIHKITFEYPADSSFTMVKNENVWMADGIALDSASVAGYLTDICNIKGSSFNKDVPTTCNYKVKIHLKQGSAIEVQGKVEEEQAYILSSQNTGSAFKEKTDQNFKKLFVSKHSLLK